MTSLVQYILIISIEILSSSFHCECRAVVSRELIQLHKNKSRHNFINNLLSVTCFGYVIRLQAEYTIVIGTVRILQCRKCLRICWHCNYTVFSSSLVLVDVRSADVCHFLIVVFPCILISTKLFLPTNALFIKT